MKKTTMRSVSGQSCKNIWENIEPQRGLKWWKGDHTEISAIQASE